MGGHIWYYFVAYQPDIHKALQELRQREFKAGRYNPVMDFPEFPVTPDSPSPGAQHDSIEEALEASEADGTRSILDMMQIGETSDFSTVVPLTGEQLIELYGTQQPTRQMIEENMDFFAEIDRGAGVYTTAYKDGKPAEIFFAGISFD
ncbi:MAG TPA: hypothetical protein VFA71_05940 [Terriglobales bacterium]|nr:hypothetical protein [Terriglobales bacterium]